MAKPRHYTVAVLVCTKPRRKKSTVCVGDVANWPHYLTANSKRNTYYRELGLVARRMVRCGARAMLWSMMALCDALHERRLRRYGQNGYLLTSCQPHLPTAQRDITRVVSNWAHNDE